MTLSHWREQFFSLQSSEVPIWHWRMKDSQKAAGLILVKECQDNCVDELTCLYCGMYIQCSVCGWPKYIKNVHRTVKGKWKKISPRTLVSAFFSSHVVLFSFFTYQFTKEDYNCHGTQWHSRYAWTSLTHGLLPWSHSIFSLIQNRHPWG